MQVRFAEKRNELLSRPPENVSSDTNATSSIHINAHYAGNGPEPTFTRSTGEKQHVDATLRSSIFGECVGPGSSSIPDYLKVKKLHPPDLLITGVRS